MRSDTISFTPGSEGGAFGGPSIGLAVADLKACSAAVSGSVGRRAMLTSCKSAHCTRNRVSLRALFVSCVLGDDTEAIDHALSYSRSAGRTLRAVIRPVR